MLNTSLLKEFDDSSAVRHGLPGLAYTDDAFMQLEQNHLFNNNWVFVGYAHELVRKGDAAPIEVAGLPLFLIRNQENEITAFHNVCRHRNLKLIDKADSCGKLIRCHVTAKKGIMKCLSAGVDVFDHADSMDREVCRRRVRDDQYCFLQNLPGS